MRIRFWDRLLIAVAGIIVLAIGLSAFVTIIGVLPVKFDASVLETDWVLWQRVAIAAGAALLIVLGLYCICMLFRRKRDKGFIIQQTEYGDMSISMNAMENMVKKCVDSHKELTVNHTRIHRSRNGVVVDMKITLTGGVNIPLAVNALQKQISQYITSCSGVDVQEVRVMVETNTQNLTPPTVDLTEAETVTEPTQEAAEPAHEELIFSHTEEPERYATPVNEEETHVEPEQSVPAYVEDVPEEASVEMVEETDSEAETVAEPEGENEFVVETYDDQPALETAEDEAHKEAEV